jgi:hypothetical protein
MSDMRIQYDEEMVGAGHPTKSDTLNRLALVECDSDGHGKFRYLKAQTTAPTTAAGEGVLYTKLVDGTPELFFRGESDGGEVQITKGGALMASPKSIQEVNATFTTTNSGTNKVYEVPLATSVVKANSHFEPTGQAGSYSLLDGGGINGIYLQGITIKDDGSALEVRVIDNKAATYRITGYVIEYPA